MQEQRLLAKHFSLDINSCLVLSQVVFRSSKAWITLLVTVETLCSIEKKSLFFKNLSYNLLARVILPYKKIATSLKLNYNCVNSVITSSQHYALIFKLWVGFVWKLMLKCGPFETNNLIFVTNTWKEQYAHPKEGYIPKSVV